MMKREILCAAAAALAAACLCSCASLGLPRPGGRRPALAEDPAVVEPAATEAGPPPVGAVAPEPAPSGPRLQPVSAEPLDTEVEAAGPSLTEALQRALEMLDEEKQNNEELKETIAGLRRSLEEKEQRIRELTEQLERMPMLEEALEKWKADVLGYRDEMRTALESMIELQVQMVDLLKEFKRERDSGRDSDVGTAD